jgi:hypothetical protein
VSNLVSQPGRQQGQGFDIFRRCVEVVEIVLDRLRSERWPQVRRADSVATDAEATE